MLHCLGFWVDILMCALSQSGCQVESKKGTSPGCFFSRLLEKIDTISFVCLTSPSVLFTEAPGTMAAALQFYQGPISFS